MTFLEMSLIIGSAALFVIADYYVKGCERV